MDLEKLSQKLLSTIKANNDASSYVQQLNAISFSQLYLALNTDEKKKAFWINIYNAYASISLRSNPSVISNPITRKYFFNKKLIPIANIMFSLNNIEHDILRKSNLWWSRGYLKKWWVTEQFQLLQTKQLDPRIHFALNCGGMGCPPIKSYHSTNINQQLDIATSSFLFSETQHNNINHTIKISALFNWYIGDFGGKKGVVAFLKKYNILPEEETPPLKIKYLPYSWTPWIK